MAKASTKIKQKSQKVKTEPPKIIAFLNGKKLRKANSYPPGTIYLYEHDYKSLMKAQKETKLPLADLDLAAKRIAEYREKQREKRLRAYFPEISNIMFGLRTPRRAKRKIKPGEEYKLVPFRNGYITRTKKNHRPGTIFITLEEYNTLINALKAGDVQEHQLDELALMFTKIREPEEIAYFSR